MLGCRRVDHVGGPEGRLMALSRQASVRGHRLGARSAPLSSHPSAAFTYQHADLGPLGILLSIIQAIGGREGRDKKQADGQNDAVNEHGAPLAYETICI
jgi:hypothetical protein